MLLGLLLVAQITVSVLLVCVVLLQRSEGGGFVGGGSPSGMMSVRGAGDLMTRITWTLGGLFFAISLLLTVIAGREKGASSVVDRLKV
ncbi:MAG: preprotein translocase, SecG subunit, partial [Phenylobacterium sp.]|nr:preprotein translocase, SecG subunit [Phenylobacterium sp.]